ncbi:hypothetical protein NC652_035701 [Populus alba x Populus x berolinensis]|nr:hypothetical protein NC652_035701 [Populus alba x Populus x berolinensis]
MPPKETITMFAIRGRTSPQLLETNLLLVHIEIASYNGSDKLKMHGKLDKMEASGSTSFGPLKLEGTITEESGMDSSSPSGDMLTFFKAYD